MHIKCVPMSKKKLKDWELDGIMFICSKCFFPERQFDSIQVLHTSGNIKYKMQLSNYESTIVPGSENAVSLAILKRNQAIVAEEYSPKNILDDGN